jgi:hypothetical protein
MNREAWIWRAWGAFLWASVIAIAIIDVNSLPAFFWGLAIGILASATKAVLDMKSSEQPEGERDETAEGGAS